MHSDVTYLLFLVGSFVFQGQAYSDQTADACRFMRCTTLQLKCHNSKIRLGYLYFSNYLNEDEKDFTEEEIYSRCSYKDTCIYKVPEWHGYLLVSVQYRCVEPDTVVPLAANIEESKEGELNLIYDMTDTTNTNTALMTDISCDVISDTLELEVWIEDFRGCPITKLYYNDAEEPLDCNHSIGMYRKLLLVQVKEYPKTSGQLLYNFTIHVKHNQPKGMFWLRFEAFDLKRITLECSPINRPTMMSHQPTLTSQISQETPSTSRTTSSSADQVTKKENKDNTGAVVGAVVTVVFVVAMVLVGCIIYQRRKRRQSTSADRKVAENPVYEVTLVPGKNTDQSREPDNTDPAKHTTESQPDNIYHEPGTSSDEAAASSDVIEEDYNTIELQSKKAFVTDPNYSHISDVTTSHNDTYSHIPAQPGTTTQGKKDESYSGDTYNHLTNTARLEVRGNSKDSSDEYSNIENLPMTKHAGQ